MLDYIKSKLSIENISWSDFLKRYTVYSLFLYVIMVLLEEDVFIAKSISINAGFIMGSFVSLAAFSFLISGIIVMFKKFFGIDREKVIYYAERIQLFLVISYPSITIFNMLVGIQ